MPTMWATMTPTFVARQLVALGFNRRDVRKYQAQCLLLLRHGGVRTRGDAFAFFADESVLPLLSKIYREDLKRTKSPVDPIGFCTWGPALHRASPWERGDHIAALRALIRDMRRRGAR